MSAVWRRPATGRVALHAITGFVAVFLVAPLLIVVPMSFSASTLMQFPPTSFSWRWYEAYFGSRAWIDATWVSLKAGIVVALLSTALGTATALALTRSRFPGRAALQAFILSPLVVPVIILSVGLYYLFSFGRLNGTMAGLVIGHVVLTYPYAVVVITASLEEFDYTLEQAALGLGATPLRAFHRIVLPLISPGIMVALLFSFLTSFDEVVLAVFITGPETTTLPRKMWEGIRFELNPTIAAVSTLLIVISSSLMLVATLIQQSAERRRANAGGRPA